MVWGFVYYHPKLVGTAWMNAAGMTQEKIESGNMPVIFILSYILSFLLCFSLFFFVVHQTAIFSIFIAEPGFQEGAGSAYELYNQVMELVGDKYRTFRHGAFHGALDGLFIIMPVLATNALFERKGFKYIMINSIYWIGCLALIGGTLSQWA